MSTLNNIVVAVDLCDSEHPVLKQAIAMAKLHQSKLHVVHVMPAVVGGLPYSSTLQEEIDDVANKKLDGLKSLVDHDPVEFYLEYGSSKQEIVRIANEVTADMIVVGSHGKHGIELILGSTANGVVHFAKCDVLTVRVDSEFQHENAGPYHNVVIATDFSPEGEKIVLKAKEMLDENAQIHVINVVPDTASLASMYVPDIEGDIHRTAEAHMKEWVAKFGLSEANCEVLTGNTKSVVTKRAVELKADLIVVGSHGRNIFESALLGSTANGVLHAAKQDTFIVRV